MRLKIAVVCLCILALATFALVGCGGESDGGGCTIKTTNEGQQLLECEDGTSTLLEEGEQGEPGSSCTVEQNADGTATVSCDDGTSATLTGGQSGLVRVDDEPTGDNCQLGGKAIHTGVDADADGELSDTEIDQTSYMCESCPADHFLSQRGPAECVPGVAVRFTGRVTEFDNRADIFPGDIPMGTACEGLFTYSLSLPDSDTSSDRGEYRHTSSRYRMEVSIDGYDFRSTPTDEFSYVVYVADRDSYDSFDIRVRDAQMPGTGDMPRMYLDLGDDDAASFDSIAAPLQIPAIDEFEESFVRLERSDAVYPTDRYEIRCQLEELTQLD